MESEAREARKRLKAVEREIRRGIVGQDELVRGLLVALVAGGHALIEGVPGLGKTRAVNMMAKACDIGFRRIQFTPDLLPADVVGTRIFNRAASAFETVRGPVFTNILLADEINRAPAKVQSALLETMQERQVTIGQESLAVSPPFHVFATQNPVEQEGTYPLPEAQLDRFLLKLVVGYPTKAQEQSIVRMVIDEAGAPAIEPCVDADDVIALQASARSVFAEDRLIAYATDLVQWTREPRRAGVEHGAFVALGASPRASISLIQAARATALIEGRDAATPDDVKAVAPAVLRHRLLMSYHAEAEGVTSDQVIDEILAAVAVP